MEGFEQVVALQSTVFPPEESYSINQILELCTLETVLYKSFWNRNRLCGLLFFNVRNEWDGSVTMEIQGTEDAIDKVILAIEAGKYVKIENMDSRMIPVETEERGFRTR